MRKYILLLFTLLLACCLAACSAKPVPKEFKSEAGRFSVVTPATLTESVQQVETQAGNKLDLHIFNGLEDEIAFIVAYNDYPPELTKPENAEAMLDGARDGAVSHSKGKLLSESNIALEGHPGREIIIQTASEDQPPLITKTHLFVVKNRLYQVTVVAPRSRAGDKAVDDFLQSFKLLGG